MGADSSMLNLKKSKGGGNLYRGQRQGGTVATTRERIWIVWRLETVELLDARRRDSNILRQLLLLELHLLHHPL